MSLTPVTVAGALNRARRTVGVTIGMIRSVSPPGTADANVKALDECYRLLGIVMDRIYPKEGR